jgi:hypothetical protein
MKTILFILSFLSIGFGFSQTVKIEIYSCYITEFIVSGDLDDEKLFYTTQFDSTIHLKNTYYLNVDISSGYVDFLLGDYVDSGYLDVKITNNIISIFDKPSRSGIIVDLTRGQERIMSIHTDKYDVVECALAKSFIVRYPY